MTATRTMVPARKGDLALLCEVTWVTYIDRPSTVWKRWVLCEVAQASRDGRVKAVVTRHGSRYAANSLRWDATEPIFVVSRNHIDAEAALREAPDWFETVEEAREFLRRFRWDGEEP